MLPCRRDLTSEGFFLPGGLKKWYYLGAFTLNQGLDFIFGNTKISSNTNHSLKKLDV